MNSLISKNLSIKRLALTALLCFFLPNLFFFAATSQLGVPRPLINIDYIFVSTLFAFGRRILGSLVLAGLLLFDLLVIQGQVYPVYELSNLLYLLSMLPHAAVKLQLAAGGLLLLLLVIIAAAYMTGHKIHRTSTLLILLVSISVYGLQNHMDESSSDFYRDKSVLVGSQTAYFANIHSIQFLDALLQDRNSVFPVGFPETVEHWAAQEQPSAGNKLLFIIAESLGVMKNDSINNAIFQPLLDKAHMLDSLQIGTTAGDTATVDAELHHLCGVRMYYYNMVHVEEGFEDCLPWRFASQGYQTISVHGAESIMYDRKYWYPRAGISSMHFRDTRDWKTRCYSFPGVCDSEIMTDFIKPVFGSNEKVFMYWLTLNTHTQYDLRDIHIDNFDCTRFNLPEGEVCRLNKLQAQFFHQLAELIEQPEMKGVEVVLVGDHSPPIMDKKAYQAHVEEGRVIWLSFKIKN